MIDQLENDLREALSEHAAEVPAQAGIRMRRIDYYSRTRRRRIAVAAGSLAASAGAVAATVSIVGLGTGTQQALAGWSASPTQPARGQTASAEATCMGQMLAPSRSSSGTWRTVLTDTRGPYTVLISQNGSNWASCFAGYPGGATGGGFGAIPPVPAADQIKVEGLANGQADPYTLYYGRVGAGVSGVTLLVADGTQVKATISNGWFAAWWPGSDLAQTAELSVENGTTTQQLHIPPDA